MSTTVKTIDKINMTNKQIYIETFEKEEVYKITKLKEHDDEVYLTKKQKQQILQPVRNSKTNPKIQNNDKCPCNSGLKYKKCCKLKY